MKFIITAATIFFSATIGGVIAQAPEPAPNDADLIYSRGYYTIISQDDFTTIIPTIGTPGFVLNDIIGTQQFQAGPILALESVKFDDEGITPDDDNNDQLYAGNTQPLFSPESVDPTFFMDGGCTATDGNRIGNDIQQILAHSCVFNLCLGGGGFNCLALYCGTSFIFAPLDNNQNTKKTPPSLPPAYPCTIFGGTNAFQGARGTVDIFTITGSTNPAKLNTPPQGLITQLLNVISNVPLPPVP